MVRFYHLPLASEIFDTLLEASVIIERWRREYNLYRPHSSLEYRPPAPEAFEAVKFNFTGGTIMGGSSVEKRNAEEGTRTPTPEYQELAPQASVSTNSTTSASKLGRQSREASLISLRGIFALLFFFFFFFIF